jgi:hypothetical protein
MTGYSPESHQQPQHALSLGLDDEKLMSLKINDLKMQDPLEGRRCLSCGKLVPKKFWSLPKSDVNGCGFRPLCSACA